jgi:hypothetical protein
MGISCCSLTWRLTEVPPRVTYRIQITVFGSDWNSPTHYRNQSPVFSIWNTRTLFGEFREQLPPNINNGHNADTMHSTKRVIYSMCLPIWSPEITLTGTVLIYADPHIANGSHWLAIRLEPKSSTAFYFFSYGLPPNIHSFLKRTCPVWEYNKTTPRSNQHRLRPFLLSFYLVHLQGPVATQIRQILWCSSSWPENVGALRIQIQRTGGIIMRRTFLLRTGI